MSIFSQSFYQVERNHFDVDGYRQALQQTLVQSQSPAEHDHLLRQEVVEITRHITTGIRDLVEHSRHVRHLVLNLGVVPLATWAEALDTLAKHSMPALKQKINKCNATLSRARLKGFQGRCCYTASPPLQLLKDSTMLSLIWLGKSNRIRHLSLTDLWSKSRKTRESLW